MLVSAAAVDYSDADECVAFGEAIGIHLDEYQELWVRLHLGKDASGDYVHLTLAISIPRQNGKNEAEHLVEMYLLVFKGARIMHTAHRTDTAKESFERIREFFDEDSDFPQLVRLVAGGPKHGICRVDGKQSIRLANGGTIRWAYRSNGGKRGFANISLLVLDEAQDLTAESMAALKYTMAASKTTRQLVYMGTPPGPETNGAEFSQIRRKLMDGETRGAYMQFGIESLGDDPWETVRDVDNWYLTNPAMGTRLDEGYTRDTELGTANTPEEFARERLGWWAETGVASNAVDPRKWRALGGARPPEDGRTCFAVKFSPDGETGTLAVAVRPDDGGPIFVEVVENRSMREGVGPFADWLLARRDRASFIAIDGAANAQPLRDRLREGREGARPIKGSAMCLMRVRDVADACAMLANAVKEGAVAHSGQPGAQTAMEGTCKRPIGSSGGWGFESANAGVDATVPEALAIAYWAAKTTKRDARRKGRIG